MPTEKELIGERLKKREELLKLGINPYPYKFSPTHHSVEILDKYKGLKDDEKTKEVVRVAGRIMAFRRMGKASFMHILDQSGKIQAFFRVDDLKNYDALKLFDIGDWIGVEGVVFKTKTGEVSVWAQSFEMLCKAVRPLPEKWHGLKDVEQRYRKRYLDLAMNPEVRDTFVKYTKIVDAIRNILNSRNFLEVHTPILQPIYGGANAKPFKTHLNALKMDVFLRISDELYLKRLLVGGFERVYEFAKDFRNEDIDRTHNPEFTQIEIYQAFADFNDMKELVMDLYIAAAKAVHGSTKFEYQGHVIDVKKPWPSFTMAEALLKFAGIDVDKLSLDDMNRLCVEHAVEVAANPSKGLLIQALFEELVEKKLIQPTFITHHPIESTPLCKSCREPHMNEHYCERFEPFIAGMEIANAYSELNDPVQQRKLLEAQAEQLRSGSEEAHPMDEDFVEAIEYGMPPTGGVGIGIDRMVMIITNNPSIRDVLFFPFMGKK
ncbi:lysine--tRNA ligase [Candidatus Woesearchaeota archaeon]|nr:lysine--tRNA ligase [Candidatus Woesearchaeota archaeon]